MERLLERACAAADQAEVWSTESSYDSLEFTGGKLHDTGGSRMSGVSLRLIRDGRLGFGYARNLVDPDDLVGKVSDSLIAGVEAGFDLPHTAGVEPLATFDGTNREVTVEDLLAECCRVHARLSEATDGEIIIMASRAESRLRILNSAGTDLESRQTSGTVAARVVYPGSGSAIARFRVRPRFGPMPDRLVDEIVRLFTAPSEEVRPETGRMKVLFMPGSAWALVWRLMSGTSAKSVHEGISPIASRVGERVVGEEISFLDDARNLEQTVPRSFDDEGVACRRRAFIEKGVLRGFFADLNYAAKLGLSPTGHGWRSAMFGGDSLTMAPVPFLRHLVVEPGEDSLDELIRRMDRGLLLEGCLGGHSGNIPNGDYSVGVSPALWVENGEIVGRVKDAMVAGNVWETLSNVVAVGRDAQAVFGLIPPILCDDVSVAFR